METINDYLSNAYADGTSILGNQFVISELEIAHPKRGDYWAQIINDKGAKATIDITRNLYEDAELAPTFNILITGGNVEIHGTDLTEASLIERIKQADYEGFNTLTTVTSGPQY